MENNFVTAANLKTAQESGANLRNLLCCMQLAAEHPDADYHAVASSLFPLAFSLCDEVNISISAAANAKKEASV